MSPSGDPAPGYDLPDDDVGDKVPAVLATSPAAAVWVMGASASPECCRPRLRWPYRPERTAHHRARRLMPTGTLPRLGCRRGGRCPLIGVDGLLPR